MKPSLKAPLERLGSIQAVDRVSSGSPADLVIRPKGALAKVKTIDAMLALARRGVKALTAKRAVEAMVDEGEAMVSVPTVEPGKALAKELRAAGVAVCRIATEPVDVKALRDRLGMSAPAFARRYGLNVRTVEGWEQGRPIDAPANNYLMAIAADPIAVARALEQEMN